MARDEEIAARLDAFVENVLAARFQDSEQVANVQPIILWHQRGNVLVEAHGAAGERQR